MQHNGKELCRFHDPCSQHPQALKAIGYDDPSGPFFVTSLVEMELDQSAKFEWQKHTQENLDVPQYAEILEFIKLQARASETVFRECPKRHLQPVPSKNTTPIRTTYVANVDTACMSCGFGKYPLYACRKFKYLLPEQCKLLSR